MEPLFFKAENVIRDDNDALLGGFNGAAFFQSGKLRRLRVTATRKAGFNGAAFFQSGKFAPGTPSRRRPRASMEPLFFKAENVAG